jgi:hypothetical protein
MKGIGSEKLLTSVLVTAFRRRQYILSALASALRQTLPPDEFEVIVLVDPTLGDLRPLVDSLSTASRISLKFVVSTETRLGPFFIDGAKMCTGRYISFLNDDDEWFPEKLDRLRIAAREHPDMVLFKHHARGIDPAGRALPEWDRRLNRRLALPSRRTAKGFLLGPGPSASDLRQSSPMLPMWNESTMSIARDDFLKFSDYFEEIGTAEDAFIFFVALCSGKPSLLSTEILGSYRVHNESMTTNNPGVSQTVSSRIYRPTTEAERAFRVIRDLAWAHGNVAVRRAAQRQLTLIEGLQIFYGGSGRRGDAIRTAIGLTSQLRVVNLTQNLAMLQMMILAALSPKLAWNVFTNIMAPT